MKKSTCRGCGAPIVWIRTAAGKSMPCDAEPVLYKAREGAAGKIITGNGTVLSADIGGDPSFLWCDRKGSCAGEDEEELVCTDERLLACVVRWLGSPAKEGKNSGY